MKKLKRKINLYAFFVRLKCAMHTDMIVKSMEKKIAVREYSCQKKIEQIEILKKRFYEISESNRMLREQLNNFMNAAGAVKNATNEIDHQTKMLDIDRKQLEFLTKNDTAFTPY